MYAGTPKGHPDRRVWLSGVSRGEDVRQVGSDGCHFRYTPDSLFELFLSAGQLFAKLLLASNDGRQSA